MKYSRVIFGCALLMAAAPVFADPPAAGAPPASQASSDAPSLKDTLSWMDYTYNPQVAQGFFGHGIRETYDNSGNSNLFSRVLETFVSKGCQMELHIEDDPTSTLSGVHSKSVQTFNMRDIDPQSVVVHSYDSHDNGEECNDPDVVAALHMNCDMAEITFSTRNNQPLITVVATATDPQLSGPEAVKTTHYTAASSVWEVNNPEYAGRFARAFAHGVDLCTKSQ